MTETFERLTERRAGVERRSSICIAGSIKPPAATGGRSAARFSMDEGLVTPEVLAAY